MARKIDHSSSIWQLAEFWVVNSPHLIKENGNCYVEFGFGDGQVGKVDVDFFSGPSPIGYYTEVSVDLVADKQYFGSSRQARWFG